MENQETPMRTVWVRGLRGILLFNLGAMTLGTMLLAGWARSWLAAKHGLSGSMRVDVILCIVGAATFIEALFPVRGSVVSAVIVMAAWKLLPLSIVDTGELLVLIVGVGLAFADYRRQCTAGSVAVRSASSDAPRGASSLDEE